MISVGIDLGGTNIAVGVVDESGHILASGTTPTLPGRSYQAIIKDMADCTLSVLNESGYPPEAVRAIGVGVPGIATNNTGTVIFCANLAWQNVPLRAELQKFINKPVFIDNDATVAGLAESVAGVSVGTHSSVFVTLGTGVGSGIIIDGKPWSGAHGIGGELGHITVAIDGEPCSCGKKGCLERYCSATALIRMGKEALLADAQSIITAMCGGDLSNLNAKIIFDAARDGDAVASSVIRAYIKNLALSVNTIISFLDPEIIVLGGGVSKAGAFLLDALRAELPRYLLFKSMPIPRVELALLGAEAGIIGAAMLGE